MKEEDIISLLEDFVKPLALDFADIFEIKFWNYGTAGYPFEATKCNSVQLEGHKIFLYVFDIYVYTL